MSVLLELLLKLLAALVAAAFAQFDIDIEARARPSSDPEVQRTAAAPQTVADSSTQQGAATPAPVAAQSGAIAVDSPTAR